jgi:hypothetical protein
MLKTVSSITNAIGALNYKGVWNATTNTPALASGVGTKGDYYVVSVAGSTTLDGISNWGVGDWAVYNGAVWQRVEGGADLNGVNLTFTGTASGPTYENINLTTGVTLTNNSLSADGTDTNIDLLANPKGTGGFGINGAPAGVVAGAAFTSKFCVKNENSSAIGGFVQANNTTATAGSGIFACRSRGTLAAPTVVQSGDNLASLFFLGNDGTDLAIAATMQIDVDGTPGNNDMPGRIVFKTTPDGSEIPVEAMRINSSGGVQHVNTISVGAATPSTSGAGITFPAAQSASTDANTLDDYEEGPWSPELTPTTGAFTTIAYGARVGRYTKIGRLVTVEGYLYTTGAITLGTAAGMLTISGLPFTTAISSVGAIWTNPVTASYNSPLALPNKVLALGTSLQMYKAGTVNDAQFIVTTDLRIIGGNSNYFAFTATYSV